ncbi:PTS sugar transporter subunit IIA [Egicoccus sp. AB-alg2]|uniref:PTS sugar transporter subunit IIA n=1 Tax=Egicoccus sp. AB-alg2 TaxID=3242693 RepID=UPI00359DACF1
MTTTIADLIDTQLVTTDLAATDRDGAIAELTALLAADGRVTDPDTYVKAVLAREEETGGTGMESGIAIPHAKSPAVTRAAVAFGRSGSGLDFGAEDGTPADLVFLIAAPEGADDLHVRVLSRLARRLIHSAFRTALREADSSAAVVDVIHREVEL